jgi:hypothetical protein
MGSPDELPQKEADALTTKKQQYALRMLLFFYTRLQFNTATVTAFQEFYINLQVGTNE